MLGSPFGHDDHLQSCRARPPSAAQSPPTRHTGCGSRLAREAIGPERSLFRNHGSRTRVHRAWLPDPTWSSTASLCGEGDAHWSPCVARWPAAKEDENEAALATATRRKQACPTTRRTRPGGRGPLVVRLRRLHAPLALCNAAATAWARRWWTQLPVPVQRATAPSPALELALDLTDAAGPCTLPPACP